MSPSVWLMFSLSFLKKVDFFSERSNHGTKFLSNLSIILSLHWNQGLKLTLVDFHSLSLAVITELCCISFYCGREADHMSTRILVLDEAETLVIQVHYSF